MPPSVICGPLASSSATPSISLACASSHWKAAPSPLSLTGSSATSWISMSSPAPPSRTSSAGAAEQHVVAGAAEQHVVAVAADQHVVAVAAVGRELRWPPADRPEASTTSSPARALTVSRSLAASAPVMLTWAARPSTEMPAAVADDQDDVVAVGAVDDDGVRLRRRRRRRRPRG